MEQERARSRRPHSVTRLDILTPDRSVFWPGPPLGDRGCDAGGAVVYKSERIALQVMTSVGAARSVRFVKIGDPGAVLD